MWLIQQPDKQRYTVGETAVINCTFHTDQSIVKLNQMKWVIPHPVDKDLMIDLPEVYTSRLDIKTSGSFSALTLNNLNKSDTYNLQCVARYRVNNKMDQIIGNGTVLQIFNKVQPTGMVNHLLTVCD